LKGSQPFTYKPYFEPLIMLTKLEKKEYRKLGKLILSLPTDSKQFHEITPRFLELNQKRYNPFYNRGAK